MAWFWKKPSMVRIYLYIVLGLSAVRGGRSNICINPEVRVSKEGRTAGVLDNSAGGPKIRRTQPQEADNNMIPKLA
ncbi:hypothetical protein QJS04_geneDACA003195 [Acorus gramineus]|uniref:Secreted protein n=1 Tax=Acorus gramineus TaxID=55184 RepID=A0AAV9BVT5_ACOGR|nr:hypothetical protein QJS04_geneDACA003195 [Acorus gramineus]